MQVQGELRKRKYVGECQEQKAPAWFAKKKNEQIERTLLHDIKITVVKYNCEFGINR